ncbi:MAG: tripartite tricarboxylate transporter substrate binding protein [Burkholderiales bacterium]|nr:tripartite tricarboxylate transporter substrate binding protein [Burkholderiales bacterium]
MFSRRQFVAGATASAALAATGQARAQAWPAKPVRVINPFPAGGGTDAFLRPIAARLSTTMGQQFTVENLGGAGGTVGAAAAAKAPADGYTLFCGAVHHTIAETLYTRLPYNLERDFVPITVLAYVPNVAVIHPKFTSINSIADLIAYAKKNPGRLNFGSAGNGTSHHLTVELFKQITGTFMVHIPYRGAGPLMVDLLAGAVDFAFDGMGTSAAQIRGGKLKPLAVTSTKRTPAFPNIPTMQEAGIKGYEATTWYALWAVRGTPPEVISRTQEEVAKALQEPSIKEIWFNQGAEPGGNSPADFTRFIRSEIEKWAKVVKASGAKIDL